MDRTDVEDLPRGVFIAPVFWAWAQQQAAPLEPLHLTRRRALRLQMQADADLAKALLRQEFLAMTRAQGNRG
jgi:hypothetical protein